MREISFVGQKQKRKKGTLQHCDCKRGGEAAWGEWAHWLSQTYFLSATTATPGERVHFSHVIRIEQLTAGLTELAAALGACPACSLRTLPEVHKRLVHARTQADGNRTAYVEALLSRSPLAVCRVCRLYARDYACLGYPLPTPCASPECPLDALELR